jgi:hypothetical protein
MISTFSNKLSSFYEISSDEIFQTIVNQVLSQKVVYAIKKKVLLLFKLIEKSKFTNQIRK